MKRIEVPAVLVALENRPYLYIATVMGEQVPTEALRQISKIFLSHYIQQSEPKELSDHAPCCYEISLLSHREISLFQLRQEILNDLADAKIDVALQVDEPKRRSKKLVVFDMDSTLIQNEVIDELAREKKIYREVAAITQKAMSGEIDFDSALRQRCEKLKGLTFDHLETVNSRLQLNPGAESLVQALKILGCKTAVVSGGFTFFTDRLQKKLGLDFAHANHLEIQNQKVTGSIRLPFVNAEGKADFLEHLMKQERCQPNEVIAVGDGANDILMLKKAGLGIAFHAKPIVQKNAHFSFNQKDMTSILYLLGLSKNEIPFRLGPSIKA